MRDLMSLNCFEPPLIAPVHDSIQTLLRDGIAVLPVVEGLGWAQVARWSHRSLLSQESRAGALVLLRFDGLDGEVALRALAEALAVAEGGWLVLGEGWERLIDKAATALAARRAGVSLLLCASGPVCPLPQELDRIIELDRLHLVGTDPGLGPQRRSLLTHARSAGVVHLCGPAGAGRRSLFHLAHALLGWSEPLFRVSRARATEEELASCVPGSWALYEDPANLTAEDLEPLRDRLLQETPPPSWAPPSPRSVPPRPDHRAFDALIGDSPAFREALNAAALFARDGALDVLLLGERGVGKELFAHAIHAVSGRTGAFVAVDLASRSEELIEADLFGSVRGAYTGATHDRPGAFRRASGGTLFLDELGNVPLRLQATLLRVLQEREVTPLGTDRSVQVDVRIISATNADLRAMVRRGTFRADLLDRLNAASVVIPPLRARGEDIVLLAEAALPRSAGRHLSAEISQILLSWPWPGNVRELRARVREAAARSRGAPIEREHMMAVVSPPLAPVALVSEGPASDSRNWRLPSGLAAWATATTIAVPALRDRGQPSVRAALLCALDGKPISRVALEVLSRRAWWGGLPELVRATNAIKAGIVGLVDLAGLEARLPHLLDAAGLEPIRILANPALQADGEPVGPRVDLEASSVLVGRARSLGDAMAEDSRGANRAVALERLCDGLPPALFSLEGPAALGRAHMLITRSEDGLLAHLLPGAQLSTYAGQLGKPALPLEVGRPRAIGQAGEIRILAVGGGSLALQIFVFLGELAWSGAQGLLRERVPARVDETEDLFASGGATRCWALRDDERDALAETLVEAAISARPLATVIREAAIAWRETKGMQRLAEYLDSSHPSQSARRLFEHRLNGSAAVVLRALLDQCPDAEAALTRLPTWAQVLIRDDVVDHPSNIPTTPTLQLVSHQTIGGSHEG